MKTLEFCIPFPPYSANNQYGATQRGGRYLKPRQIRWREDAMLITPAFVIGDPDSAEVEISLWFFAPDRQDRDVDNFTKVVFDALKKAWGIDDHRFSLKDTPRISYDYDSPRVEVRATLKEG